MTFVAGITLVALYRLWFFHDLIARQYIYLYDVAVPAAIGATLAFIVTTPEDISRRALARPGPPTMSSTPEQRLRSPLLAVAAVCLFVGSSTTDSALSRDEP